MPDCYGDFLEIIVHVSLPENFSKSGLAFLILHLLLERVKILHLFKCQYKNTELHNVLDFFVVVVVEQPKR